MFYFVFSPPLLLLFTLQETKDLNLTGTTLTRIIIIIIIIKITIIEIMLVTKTENMLISTNI